MSDGQPAPLSTELTRRLSIRHPVVQTAMGWVSTPELVAGTGNAGGIGILAAATMRPDEVVPAINRVRELSDAPFGVNFLMEQPNAAEIVDAICEHGVAVASYNRAPRADLIAKLKAAGVLCMPTVGSRRHAEKAQELGADMVVCQGAEGGGHTGQVPTSLLVSDIVDAVDIPVVAAGGFHDGRGLVAALSYGAVGVAMGTRFLLTEESPVPEPVKRRYLAAGLDDTVVTREIDGLPQRVLHNRLIDSLEGAGPVRSLIGSLRSGHAYRKQSGASLLSLLRSSRELRRRGRTFSQVVMAANAPILVREALVAGDPDSGVLPSGQVAGSIESLLSCRELIEAIVEEAVETIARLDKYQEVSR